MSAPRTLGVVVPCRNEADVVARKLLNLARAAWPAVEPGASHRLVVVDDGSDDGTVELARETLARCQDELEARGVQWGVAWEVVRNDVRPGKPGAIAAGLARLADTCELVVLTDADVCVEEDALVALAAAFDDERLAMACGAQRFVRGLAEDGTPAGPEGGPLVDAAAGFDRWTALVRRVESARGRLFSVHGQLLAWRASLALAPTPGLAADDLDLMLQVREARARARAAGPWRVELVPAARFLEVKTSGARAPEQELRRARAYVQVVRAWDGRAAARGAQWAFYRHVPLAAPALTLAFAVALPLGAGLAFGAPGAVAGVALVALACATPQGRGWLRLALRIREAVRAQREEALPERWEMARR